MKRYSDGYEISKGTMAIFSAAHESYGSKILDLSGEYFSEKIPMELIRSGCLDGGSTYEGRKKAVIYHTNICEKIPIPISLLENIYAFPTHAPIQFENVWIFYHHVKEIRPFKNKSIVVFKNNQTLELGVSFYVLKKQIERTAYCEFRFSQGRTYNEGIGL
ncbi:competence protein ComK [Bacillus taeanensis]|uniref:Competence protein n=1 Tax=Bacillus taeanensis TaxID=273032 RepID=A0A366XUN4_9BACI|nr:competence protein ComK [Bacillus taeanensis]RBW68855.1 competence protein [Bacillus taeanensis]